MELPLECGMKTPHPTKKHKSKIFHFMCQVAVKKKKGGKCSTVSGTEAASCATLLTRNPEGLWETSQSLRRKQPLT